MTLENNNVNVRCDLCGIILKEREQDVRELSKPYEIPYKIEWNGIECTITNKVVRHICCHCLDHIMDAVRDCMK